MDLLEASSVLLPLPLSTPCPCGENRNVLFTDLARIIKGSPRQLLSRKFWRNGRTKWSSSLQPRTAAQDHSSVCAGQKREQCLRPICVIRWHLSLWGKGTLTEFCKAYLIFVKHILYVISCFKNKWERRGLLPMELQEQEQSEESGPQSLPQLLSSCMQGL